MKPSTSHGKRLALLLAVAIPAALVVGLRTVGMWGLFKVASGAMAPSLEARDRVLMEGLSYRLRSPRRGEIVVFRTTGIPGLPQDQYWIKRVIGLPGEHVVITNGAIRIDDEETPFVAGGQALRYLPPPAAMSTIPWNEIRLPADRYFLLGDNSTNSYDGRFWGSVPKANIVGRTLLRCWPPERLGRLR